MTLEIVHSVEALRDRVGQWRRSASAVALVPTMGALHAGHLSLVERARREAARTIVSIFVNPTQFAPTEDFATYPRTFEADCAMLDRAGADLVYAPGAATMYPDGFATTVSVRGPAEAGLEDAVRPHFFSGVATVVAKLLSQCAPDVAIFGEKDYQQLQVVTRMAQDLDLPVRIVGAETIREADGLAMSSRNRFLSAPERTAAAALPRVLEQCATAMRQGEPFVEVLARGRQALAAAGFAVDYLEARNAIDLGPADDHGGVPVRLLAAARIGSTRLIDNWPV